MLSLGWSGSPLTVLGVLAAGSRSLALLWLHVLGLTLWLCLLHLFAAWLRRKGVDPLSWEWQCMATVERCCTA